MILSYIRLATRIFFRNPFFTAINLVGLSIGFASFLILWPYAIGELRSDRAVKDGERIARIGFDMRGPNNEGVVTNLMFGTLRAQIAPKLLTDFPEIESVTRVLMQHSFFMKGLVDHGTRLLFSSQDNTENMKIFREERVFYGEENFFTFFSIPLIAGNPASVLSEAGYAAVSESTARRYFGNDSPLGRQLVVNGTMNLHITGVFPDRPHNTHLSFDIIMANKGLVNRWNSAFWGLTHTYVKLRRDASMVSFDAKLKKHWKGYWADLLADHPELNIVMFAQPLYEVPFSINLIQDNRNFQRSYTLLVSMAVLSVVILILGWINYINLSLSSLSRRFKEFGARRASGARSRDLIIQVLIESSLINLLAMALAFTMIQTLGGPATIYFDMYVPNIWQVGWSAYTFFGMVILAGILFTGLYPGLVCLRPAAGLLSASSNAPPKSVTVSLLTTLQYVSAMVLILWSFTVNKQLNYILDKDIGMNRDRVVVIEGPVIKTKRYLAEVEVFTSKLKSFEGINDLTYSRYMLGEANTAGSITAISSKLNVGTMENGVPESYIPFFGINLLAGRNFVRNDRSEAIIVSRRATEGLGYSDPAEAIGLHVDMTHGEWIDVRRAEIVGVIEDYSRRPFLNRKDSNKKISNTEHEGIVLTYNNSLFPELIPENISIRLDSLASAREVMQRVEAMYNEIFHGNTFNWRFLDDRINDSYKKEIVARNQITLFTGLSIIISCLGLLGIVTNRSLRMTKEMSVRKVLGARLHHLAVLLVHSTSRQMVVAMVVGIPVAYLLTGQYLERFSDRILLHWWHYGIPVIALLSIMAMTISGVIWRAARSNPVDGLKHE